MKRLIVGSGAAVLVIFLSIVVGNTASGCGAALFPDCSDAEPCPPCTGFEKSPDPCVSTKRDAGKR